MQKYKLIIEATYSDDVTTKRIFYCATPENLQLQKAVLNRTYNRRINAINSHLKSYTVTTEIIPV